jgi:carbon starvation protein CstA
MALLSIPSDNITMGKSKHPWVSERERLKTLGTMIQQMLLVVGATFVVQTKTLIKDHPYFYEFTYLCAITLFMGFFTFTIRQPPHNKSLFECVFLIVIIATMTVLIALITKLWIGIAYAMIWAVGIYFFCKC